MKIQDKIVDMTREAQAEAFRYAKAVPGDKLEWKPLDAGRTVFDLARELTQCPDWTVDLLNTGRMDWSPESQEASAKESASWTTIEDCDAACKEKLEKLYAVIRAFPDERLAETIVLPFGPDGSDKSFTMEEIMAYPQWNCTYHLGQIGYIQRLYGDNGMH